MSAAFDLHVSTNPAVLTADLRLCDAAGNHLARREIRLADHPASRWEGLFDLRRYVRHYVGSMHPLGSGDPLDEAGLVCELGVFLGREILGGSDPQPGLNLFGHLARGIRQRTLRVRLPPAAHQGDHLAAALARVPWEIARLDPAQPTLAEKNVLIRALSAGPEPQSGPQSGPQSEPQPGPLDLGPDESLQVLLVFAEAPGSRPLAARLERQQLLELFRRQVYPRRRVTVDVLCHGVTRERLMAQINDKKGYHVVHWSGHGHLNLLELHSEGSQPSRLTGQELVGLFSEAGGYFPRLVFLSACHSGNLLSVKDSPAFQAILEGRDPEGKDARADAPPEALGDPLHERPGYTGTAQALLEAGVPTVVAMRYEVGDDYACDLAVRFYEHLLADESPKRPDEALSQARRSLLQAAQAGTGHGYAACDHATPVLFGAADPGLKPPEGSTPLPAIHPDLRIRELRPHPNFVGRTWELAGLGARWLEAKGQRPVAVVRGLGGLGKTALAAEAIGLWHERFRWVFAFQAKPMALGLDDFLRRLHTLWMEQQGQYTRRVTDYPAEAVWRPALGELTGDHRHEALRANLVRALVQEPVLLVLDNFESCLMPGDTGVSPVLPKGHWQDARANPPGHACQDPGWDLLLAALAEDLVGTNSRVLVTSRWALAPLADNPRVEDLTLGPLPSGEAALYIRTHPVLHRLFFQPGSAGRKLVMRLLHASRGHPLLLDRLARLAERDPQTCEAALERLKQEGLAQLPEFFAADPRDAAERRYLEDALAGSIDLLLERVGPDARRLLWVLSLANEPVIAGLWREVWEAEDFEPLRRTLVQAALVSEERKNEADEDPEFTCHELVRERVAAWIARHPVETGGRTREQVWAAYGDRYVLAYKGLVSSNQRAAGLEAGSRALRYVVRAGAFDKLGGFASQLVTSTNDPSVLRALLPELEHAAEAAPPGKARWSARTCLAEGLSRGGQPDASLAHYTAAAAEAEQAEHWSDLAWITGNWAGALVLCGHLEASQKKHRESAQLSQRAGRPAVNVLGRELEALRIDVMRGRAAEALPEIETRLARIRSWWEQVHGGEAVPESPDAEFLGRAFTGALDIAYHAHLALEQWEAALERIGEIIAVDQARGDSEHAIARHRFNRYSPLLRLGRVGEAQRELEHCLEVDQRAGDEAGRASDLSALADVFDEKRDLGQAIALERRALAIRNTLPDPTDRAISHNNLGNYFQRAGHLAQTAPHELAAMLYRLVIGHRQDLQTSAHNHVVRLVDARRAGREHTLPRVAELVAQPEFAPLADWLAAAKVDLAQLQQQVDAFLTQCRQQAEASLAEPP